MPDPTPGSLVYVLADSSAHHPVDPPVALYLGADRDGVVWAWTPVPGQKTLWGPVRWERLNAHVSGLHAEVITFGEDVAGWMLPETFRGFTLPRLVVLAMPWGGWEDFPTVEAAADNLRIQHRREGLIVRHGPFGS